MASWRWIAILAAGALALGGCGSSSDDDGSGGESSGGTGGSGGSGGTGGTGGSAGGPAACGTLTSEDASRIAGDNLASVLHGAVESTRFVEWSTLVQKLLGHGPEAEEPFAFADDANASIDQFVDALRTEVFVDANVESATESSVTYHLTPEVNCPLDEEYFAFDPDGATLEQEECSADLLAHPVRYTVSRIECDYGDSVNIELESGEERIVPGVLTATAASLGLRLDVAETARAIQADDPDALMDADSTGTVVASVTNGYGLTTFALALESDIVLGSLASEKPWRVAVDASPDALNLTANAETTRLAGGVHVETVDVTFPLATLAGLLGLELHEGVPTTDSVDLHLPRASSGIDFDEFSERVVLYDMELPTISIRSGGERLLSVDVNKENDWLLTSVTDLDEDGQLVLRQSPGFTLDLGFALAPLESSFVELPPYQREDRVRLALQGETPSATLLDDADGVPLVRARTEGPVLRVDAGNFVLSSELFPDESANVDEGDCLLYDPNREGEHEILRGFYADECP
jgi:hypothetical protein